MDNNQQLVKTLDRYAIIFSLVVLAAVIAMFTVVPKSAGQLPAFTHYQPFLHAILNSLTAVALMFSLYFIKQKNIAAHRALNMTAMGLSALFLVSYVVYHVLAPEVKFGDADHNGVVDAAEKAAIGTTRLLYLLLLLTHIVLAASILPFILFTFIRGYLMQIPEHRRIARWTYPIWLYVAVTGVIVYLMLEPYY